jgi:hypothetical protein
MTPDEWSEESKRAVGRYGCVQPRRRAQILEVAAPARHRSVLPYPMRDEQFARSVVHQEAAGWAGDGRRLCRRATAMEEGLADGDERSTRPTVDQPTERRPRSLEVPSIDALLERWRHTRDRHDGHRRHARRIECWSGCRRLSVGRFPSLGGHQRPSQYGDGIAHLCSMRRRPRVRKGSSGVGALVLPVVSSLAVMRRVGVDARGLRGVRVRRRGRRG